MPTPSPVMVAVDGSVRTEHVLREALRIAKERTLPIVAVRVVGLPPELPAEALGMAPAEVLDRLVEGARASLRNSIVAVGGDAASARVEVGAVVPTLLALEASLTPELLVIGAHGYRFAERVLGTTAGRLVERAHGSVLVVR